MQRLIRTTTIVSNRRAFSWRLAAFWGLAGFLVLTVTRVRADGPADNNPQTVRRVPNLGVEVSAEIRQEFEGALKSLGEQIEQLRARPDARIAELLPDVEIFSRAVGDALTYQEFFDAKEFESARQLLAEGRERAANLAQGRAPWTTQPGLVVRGYVSRLDGSVQPYGLVVPESYTPTTAGRYRLDIWFHGRGETLSEVNFLQSRRTQPGQFAPRDTIVLHPYGRYSNAFKFAGEVDVLEALDSVRARYRVDGDRISVRGFSMGGAACWQFAVHYADQWFGANPGAGFSETPEFLRFFQKETLTPTWYERQLWHWYDCTDWAENLVHCPTVAYSGDQDIQKQAADIMQASLAKVGIDLVHVIGPQTGHSYHPEAARTVERLMDQLSVSGRERLPRTVHLTTYTLKYNQQAWVTVDGLQEHWERATVDARLRRAESGIEAKTANVSDLTFEMPSGECPFDVREPVHVVLDGQTLEANRPTSDQSWKAAFHLRDGTWQVGPRAVKGPRKRHNLQGPIDDALMDSFIFVRSTSKPRHSAVGAWATSELERAIEHWRRHFRGHARVKDDRDVTEDDLRNSNLVLWGDPSSNLVLARIADQLPIRWGEDQIQVGERVFSSPEHAVVMIYPNPLSPDRYVVLNSSFTFREFAYLNNARQVAKLPDWAIVDLKTAPDSLWPGKIVDADFFDESWQLRPARR